jgi:hypothetical protein
MPEPLAVYDVHEDGWEQLTAQEQYQVRLWVVEQGMDPGDIFRLEVFLIDCPFARVYEFDRDEDGSLRVEDQPPWDFAVRPPRDVLLSSLPPVKPRAA